MRQEVPQVQRSRALPPAPRALAGRPSYGLTSSFSSRCRSHSCSYMRFPTPVLSRVEMICSWVSLLSMMLYSSIKHRICREMGSMLPSAATPDGPSLEGQRQAASTKSPVCSIHPFYPKSLILKVNSLLSRCVTLKIACPSFPPAQWVLVSAQRSTQKQAFSKCT